MSIASDEIAAIEAQLAEDPESIDLRERLVTALCLAGVDDKRAEHVVWLLRKDPHSRFVQCPLCQIQMSNAPDAFAAVEAEWRALATASPDDGVVVRGLATFLAGGKREEALQILQDFVTHSGDPDGWIDLGRMQVDASKSLEAFRRALELGSQHPVLLEWLASSALKAGDMEASQHAGKRLLEKARSLRELHGDRLDCDDTDRWARARALTSTTADAQALVSDIHAYANSTHWGHTALGAVAARAGHVSDAIEHLHASVQGPTSPRLSSYGPSFLLAQELCGVDQWDAVACYIRACERFINPDKLRPWHEDISAHRVPEAWLADD